MLRWIVALSLPPALVGALYGFAAYQFAEFTMRIAVAVNR